MKKNIFMPYNLNLKYEYKTYKNIGKLYGDSKTANLGVFYNIIRYIGKLLNRKENKYAICHTYSDWKAHVLSVFNKKILNYDDMLHWIYGQKNDAEDHVDLIKVIQFPFYIAILTMLDFFSTEPISVASIYLIIVPLVFGATSTLLEANTKVRFFEDLILIISEFQSND